MPRCWLGDCWFQEPHSLALGLATPPARTRSLLVPACALVGYVLSQVSCVPLPSTQLSFCMSQLTF